MPLPSIYTFGQKGMEIVEPSVYFKDQQEFKNQTKYKFATLQERLIMNLTSNESKFTKSGIPRPPPFDSYCPSMESKLDECVCPKCGISWPCAAAKNRHMKAHSKNKSYESTAEYQEVTDAIENEVDGSMFESFTEEAMPIIGNIKDNLLAPWEELSDEFLQ